MCGAEFFGHFQPGWVYIYGDDLSGFSYFSSLYHIQAHAASAEYYYRRTGFYFRCVYNRAIARHYAATDDAGCRETHFIRMVFYNCGFLNQGIFGHGADIEGADDRLT